MKNNTAGDAASNRVIEDITFQASVLALHNAIESAARSGEPKYLGMEVGDGQSLDDQLNSLVRLARRPHLRGF